MQEGVSIAPVADAQNASAPLFQGQVRLLYENVPTGLLVALVCVGVVCFMERRAVPVGPLALWAAATAIINTGRYALICRYHCAQDPPAQLWGRRYASIVFLEGLAWGAAGLWLLPLALIPQIFIFLMLTVMTTASVVSFAAVFPVALLFVVPTIAPLAVRLFLLGDGLHRTMALIALLFLAAMLLTAYQVNRIMRLSLTLELDNRKFIAQLEQEKGAIDRLNDELRHEVAERVQIAKRATERENYLRTVVDNVREGIVTIDADGALQSLNREALRIFGYEEDELVGRPFALLVPAAEHGEYAALFKMEEPRNAMVGFGLEVNGVRRDGSIFPMEIGFCRMSFAQQPYLVGITRDVSERKRHQRMRHDLLSTLGHELRTPLAAVSASLGLMTEELVPMLSAESGNLLRIARNNLSRLARVMEDILDIDQRQVAQWSLRHERLDLKQIVYDTLQAEQDYAASHGVRLALDSGSVSAFIRGDRNLLLRALSNLVANAVHLSPAQSVVELTVSRNAGFGTVSVRDCGTPIPASVRPHLFNALEADGVDAVAPIGLSVARAIAEKHNGVIGYAERPGGGSHFFLRFSLTRDS